MKSLLLIGCVWLMVSLVQGKSTQNPNTTASAETTEKPSVTTPKLTSPKMTTAPNHPTTTTTPALQCQKGNKSCEECVKVGSVQCVWCESKKSCTLKEHIIPTSECALADAKWAVCWVNYEALIIATSVIGGLLILGFVTCICCCCCCKKDNSAKYAKEDAKTERKKAEMKEKHSDRRAERRAKTDEIRKKYGLIKEDNPYSRFENN